jgi:hypothetical protein
MMLCYVQPMLPTLAAGDAAVAVQPPQPRERRQVRVPRAAHQRRAPVRPQPREALERFGEHTCFSLPPRQKARGNCRPSMDMQRGLQTSSPAEPFDCDASHGYIASRSSSMGQHLQLQGRTCARGASVAPATHPHLPMSRYSRPPCSGCSAPMPAQYAVALITLCDSSQRPLSGVGRVALAGLAQQHTVRMLKA